MLKITTALKSWSQIHKAESCSLRSHSPWGLSRILKHRDNNVTRRSSRAPWIVWQWPRWSEQRGCTFVSVSLLEKREEKKGVLNVHPVAGGRAPSWWWRGGGGGPAADGFGSEFVWTRRGFGPQPCPWWTIFMYHQLDSIWSNYLLFPAPKKEAIHDYLMPSISESFCFLTGLQLGFPKRLALNLNILRMPWEF